MQLRRPRRTYGSELSIAPLIDVVFLLIIFFMTVSQIARVEVEDLALPEASQGQPAAEAPAGRVIVNVLQDGRTTVGGATQTPASLRHLLGTEVDRYADGELTVSVRGDRDTRWENVARVLQACGARGISRVRVAVLEPDEGAAAP